ncbi:Crp/Fnr family transcriptional regulator [Methylicorpusculum sp.]|uniref:Crp/Fnr family transcriptional regulator n=1 Tax=Methylicorpusculum sp. TaxID=2713644 RepID=UPI002AB875DF|nr:Crp/Fnr family transcriptional regulator [Methylicorpusculum sp.]MDZ4149690.1 Crp/Fnr family transcriptional regulator [Methylicorpusculum sp.]
MSIRTLCPDPEWLGRSDCKQCGIRRTMLFSGLEDEDFDQLLEPIDNFRYSKKTLFYNQDERGNKVYSIRSGFVKLIQSKFDGSQRILRVLGPGAIVGLEALLQKPYRHTAIALQEVDACRIYTATLKHLEAEKPWLNEKVMDHWEQHLTIADRWINELSSGSVRTRALNLIKYLMEISGGNSDTVRFFGYEDMASMLGTSRETFSRIIRELKDEGVISKVGRGQVYRFTGLVGGPFCQDRA